MVKIIDTIVLIGGNYSGTYSYDKRQSKFIFKHESDIYEKGFKFYYGYSEQDLINNIEKRINKK